MSSRPLGRRRSGKLNPARPFSEYRALNSPSPVNTGSSTKWFFTTLNLNSQPRLVNCPPLFFRSMPDQIGKKTEQQQQQGDHQRDETVAGDAFFVAQRTQAAHPAGGQI